MLLAPANVLDHQAEEEHEAKKMSPNVDSLIVELEDALYAVLVLQPLSVACYDGYFFVVVRNLLYIQQFEIFSLYCLTLSHSLHVLIITDIHSIVVLRTTDHRCTWEGAAVG